MVGAMSGYLGRERGSQLFVIRAYLRWEFMDWVERHGFYPVQKCLGTLAANKRHGSILVQLSHEHLDAVQKGTQLHVRGISFV